MESKKITYAQARGYAGYTQAELAKKIKVTPLTIFNIENYKSSPSVKVFADICKVCGVSMEQIIISKK